MPALRWLALASLPFALCCPLAAQQPAPPEMQALWADLASEDAATAYRAIVRLSAHCFTGSDRTEQPASGGSGYLSR